MTIQLNSISVSAHARTHEMWLLFCAFYCAFERSCRLRSSCKKKIDMTMQMRYNWFPLRLAHLRKCNFNMNFPLGQWICVRWKIDRVARIEWMMEPCRRAIKNWFKTHKTLNLIGAFVRMKHDRVGQMREISNAMRETEWRPTMRVGERTMK